MVFVNQSFPNRTADDTAGDETEGSGGDGNGDAAVKADTFQQRAEGRCRAVTADHGNRSVASPMRGLRSKIVARLTPMIFWKVMRIVVTMAILKTMMPPRLMRLMLAV